MGENIILDFNDNALTIIFWDVQHGSASLIKTPRNNLIIYDLGIGNYSTNNASFSPLNWILTKYNIRMLDQVIVSHPDMDHIADILNLRKFSFHRFSRPHSISEEEIRGKISKTNNNYYKSVYQQYIDFTKSHCSEVNSETDPTLPGNNGGVDIKLFYPRPDIQSSRENNYSLVVVLSYANSKVLLTGDNERVSWEWLLEKQEFRETIKDTDILLASHHGRENGFCPELFDYFKPSLTIVSDGHVCDTTAASRYSAISEGWTVFNSENKGNVRKCLTTRSDGYIKVKIGYNENQKSYREVRI